MSALTRKLIKQLFNDKRSLLMIFVSPVIIISFLFFLLGTPNVYLKIGCIGANNTILKALNDLGKIEELSLNSDINKKLKNKDLDAVIKFKGTRTMVYMTEENSAYLGKINTSLSKLKNKAEEKDTVTYQYIYGGELNTSFEKLSYALLGIISFFLIFLISGIVFARERTQGTLERFMMTPVSRVGVIIGYICGIGLYAFIQAIIILLFTKYVLDVPFKGNVIMALFFMILASLVAVELGAFISIFSNSEFQVVQFIPLIIVPSR